MNEKELVEIKQYLDQKEWEIKNKENLLKQKEQELNNKEKKLSDQYLSLIAAKKEWQILHETTIET